ncbi:putative 2-dehydropantoate 2-reductase [Bordetella flabilis]|uniref:2-dehydropantoate 2-reductase n=1 Tax=Bordetella flabilis TaxID=463014 RepID=A0A193GEK0_9BORD|nr:putative 2-dehydropantoate 2-reductase [Bordetella flabilis]ANN77881.1 2-dehydropantoate 2-reductase [Bordetella flabilis]
MENAKPRIGVIGAGAIGGFYGGLLARRGREVHFLLRSEYSAVATEGIRIESKEHGDVHLDRVHAHRSPDEMPPCDWLLLGTKAVSNTEVAPTLARIAAPGARLIVMQNGLGVEDELHKRLPPDLHVVGGLCYTAVEHLAAGHLRHIAYSGLHLGYHSGPAATPARRAAVLEEGVALFAETGIAAMAVADLTAARWRKLLWNIPFNGLSVLLDCGITDLVGHADTYALARGMMEEVAGAAASCGHPLPADAVVQTMALSSFEQNYHPSMVYDHRHRRPMELQAIYDAPIRAARDAGVDMPKVEALYQGLRFIDARNRA